MHNENILVTGASGLVGSHLLFDLVSQGIRPKALIRSSSAISKIRKTFGYYSPNPDKLISQIDWVEGNVLDYLSLLEAFQGINKVYHTAAFVSFNPFEKQKIFDTNIKGTANVVNACMQNGVAKLCYVSSIAALGRSEDELPVNEETIWMPLPNMSAYSISKFHSETEVWRGIEEGLNAVIVNPSVILGPGDWSQGSSSIIQSIYNGLKYYTAGLTGYVDVRDVSKTMIQLMNSEISNQRFLLNSENCYYKDVFTMMAQSLGIKTTMVEAKPWMLQLAWRWEYLKYYLLRIPPRITKDVIKSGKGLTNYSNDKIKNTLDYNFISVKDSIKHLAECLKAKNS